MEEAEWLGRQIEMIEVQAISPMLNVGSSIKSPTTDGEDFINEKIFKPARGRNLVVTHMDMKRGPNVDIVGDLRDPDVIAELARGGFKAILCANVLEHVIERQKICRDLLSVVPVGGYIFVTCPYRYPFHPDPIDTLFRPNLTELHRLFPETSIVGGEIIKGKTFLGYHANDPLLILKTVLRIFMPFYKPRNWLGAVRKSPWLIRRCFQSCLVLRKC